MNEIIKSGQIHGENFTGYSVEKDGVWGPDTQLLAIRCVQQGLCVNVDGDWGVNSSNALRNSQVLQNGSDGLLVTALEICLMLRGYEPNGLENPGQFRNGLESAVRQYQADAGISVDGKVWVETFCSLMCVSMVEPEEPNPSGSGRGYDVISVAQSEVGYEEDGEWTKFGDYYGDPYGEWCGYFCAWCAAQAGAADVTPQGQGCGYLPTIQEWFINDDNGAYYSRANYPDYQPQVGDYVIFTWDYPSRDHVGLVESFDGSTVYTIEGNAGNEVCLRRQWSIDSGCILGFCHPAY